MMPPQRARDQREVQNRLRAGYTRAGRDGGTPERGSGTAAADGCAPGVPASDEERVQGAVTVPKPDRLRYPPVTGNLKMNERADMKPRVVSETQPLWSLGTLARIFRRAYRGGR